MEGILKNIKVYKKDDLLLKPDVPGAMMWAVGLEKTMLTYFELEPDTKFPEHSHEAEQITMVLEGELTFAYNGQEVSLKSGDVIAIPSNVIHSAYTGNLPCKAVDAWSPVRKEFLNKMISLRPASPDDMPFIKQCIERFRLDDKLHKIHNLVGAITEEQLRYVDSFVGDNIGLFMPIGGACYYALMPDHTHPSYMFILPFTDDTSLMIGDKIIAARRGRIFALSPHIPHHECPSDFIPRYIAIFIDKEFFEKELSQYPVKQDILFSGEFYEVSPDLLLLLKRFMIEVDNKIPGSDVILHAHSLEICHSIIRSIFNFGSQHDRISSRIEIDRVVEYIHSNIDHKLTVRELAKVAHMSTSHFSRIFKKEIGMSPMDYLHRIRMEMAKRLLLAGDKSITEIALDCGFNSPSYLSASFQKEYGMSPSDYKKNFKKV